MKIYKEYTYICEELNLKAINKNDFAKLCSSMGEDFFKNEQIHNNTFLDKYGNRTFLSIPSEYTSPCLECIKKKIDLLDFIYQDVHRGIINNFEDVKILVCAISVKHRIPFTYSESFLEQPWSVAFPLPGCRNCGSTDLFSWEFAKYKKEDFTEIVNFCNETSGVRRSLPKTFVKNNRYAIGYSSILPNPGQEEIHGKIFLTNGFIYTGSSEKELETAGGKGYSSDQSIASWLGEGIERYYLNFDSSTHLPLRDINEIEKKEIVDLFKLPAIIPGSNEVADPYLQKWIHAEVREVSSGKKYFAPRSLVFCPDNIPEDYVSITTSSTNGAATGSTLDEAIIQGILELIERDAFWFYCRTDAKPFGIPKKFIPDSIINFINSFKKGKFYFQILKSPFNIHVVQTTYKSLDESLDKSITARGTGASHSLHTAIYRSFAECIQLMSSLDTGCDISFNHFDMRNLWYTGKSLEVFDTFFDSKLPILKEEEYLDFATPSLRSLANAANNQGMKFFYYTLYANSGVFVVKVIGSEINSLDSEFYQNSDRLKKFSKLTGNEFRAIKYHGSTFM